MTIFGKILKGIGKVVLPVVGAVTGIGAIGGIAKGIGAIAGIGSVLATGKKVIDKVGGAAVNLVTGTTKVEREQISDVKARTKAAQDKLDQVARLIKAGATETEARATVGLSAADYEQVKSDVITAGYTPVPSGGGLIDKIKANPIMLGIGALLLIFVLPSLLKGRRR